MPRPVVPAIVVPRFLAHISPDRGWARPLPLVHDGANGRPASAARLSATGSNWPSLQYIVIAETLPLFRDALAQLAASQSPDATIVRASSVADLMELATHDIAPDLFLIDLALPGLDTGVVLPELRKQHRKAAIVTLSSDDDMTTIMQSMRAGSDAFVHKAVARERCIAAIGRVLAGEYVIERENNDADSQRRAEQAGIVLTGRQREVFDLLAQGASNKTMARELGISHLTVRLYVSALLRIFGVTKRSEVVPKARIFGLTGDR